MNLALQKYFIYYIVALLIIELYVAFVNDAQA